MPRNFVRASSEYIPLVAGPNFAYGTIACIARKADDSNTTRRILVDASGGANNAFWLGVIGSVGNKSIIMGINNSTRNSGATQVLVSDGWCLIAATKDTGSVSVRFHKYVISTNTWTHTTVGAVIADNAAPSDTGINLGASLTPDQYWDGDIAIAACWLNRALADVELENLATGLQAWLASAPSNLWLLDQDATSQLVPDHCGGAGQNGSAVGTSVSTDQPPGWTYGVGPILPMRQKVVGYKDAATRLKISIRAYADVASRLFIRATGYRFSSTRLFVKVNTFRDAASRLFVKVNTFRDVATRLNVLPSSFRNVATRLYVKVNRYADVATRFVLGIRGYANVATRFGIQPPVGMPSATPVNAEAAAILVQSEARAVVTSQTPGASPIAASPGATVTAANPAATPTVASPAAVPGPDQFPSAVVRAAG